MNCYSIAKHIEGSPVEDYIWAENVEHAKVIAEFIGGNVVGEITDDEFICEDCMCLFNPPSDIPFYNQ